MSSISGVSCERRRSICQAASPGARANPEFVSKAADIVGLYMMPPDNAVVLSVDEKPSHDYKRHGTTTLFAALEVATGKVVGRHYRRRRR
jgi:hypothetical protein